MKQSVYAWNRALSTASLVIVVLWLLLGFVTWHELVTGVRIGIPRSDNVLGQHLLFDGPIQFLPILATIILHVCAAVLGYAAVVRPIWGGRHLVSEVWLMIGGLIPGSLLLIALSRIISLFFNNLYAPRILFVIFVATAFLAVLNLRQRWRSERISLAWGDVLSAIVTLTGIFIFTIQMDVFHIVGEASLWFINEVYFSSADGVGTAEKFPLISQHYDEAALLYPAIYGFIRPGASAQDTLSIMYWIMVAVGRLGVGSLIYISLRSLRLDRLSAMVTLVFVCIATLSINAISSRLLFDSLSPLGYGLHIARILIPVMPLLLVSALVDLVGRVRPVALIVALLLGTGLSAMPIHALMVLAWALPVVVITQMSPAAANAPSIWRAATVAAMGVLLAFVLAYGLAASIPATVCVAILAASSVFGALIVIGAWLRSGIAIEWRPVFSTPVFLLLAICAGYGMGLLFLGNVFIGRMDGLLSHLWPWQGLEIADRAISNLGNPSGKLLLSPFCSGYDWEFRTLAGHCSSLPMVVRSYGLAFAMMTTVLTLWMRALSEKGAPTAEGAAPDRQRTMILCGIFLCLIAMPVSFVGFDFVAPTDAPILWQRELSIWLRSRLVEPWFYGGILLSLSLFLGNSGLRSRRWTQSAMLAATAIGGLAPLVVPGQLIINLVFIFHSVFGPL